MALSGIFCRHGRDLLRQEGLHAMLLHKTQRVQRRAGRTLTRFRGECAIKKEKWNTAEFESFYVHLCHSRHSASFFTWPDSTNGHPRPTTTKVSAGIVTEGSRTAAITAKRNHMWTKVSVCATGREHVVPLNLRPGHREAESNMD